MRTSFYFLFMIMSLCSFAQTPVKIMDLALSPDRKVNAIAADSVTINVMFKIKGSENAKKAHLMLGTTPGATNVFNIEAMFSEESGKQYISYNGKKTEVKSYAAFFQVRIPVQTYAAYLHATLFVETMQNTNTSSLFFKK